MGIKLGSLAETERFGACLLRMHLSVTNPATPLGSRRPGTVVSFIPAPRAALAVGSSHQPSSHESWSMNASGRHRPIYLLVQINISKIERN